jgi:hypothetical protein
MNDRLSQASWRKWRRVGCYFYIPVLISTFILAYGTLYMSNLLPADSHILPVPVHAKGMADYSADLIFLGIPEISLKIIEQAILDRDPNVTNLDQRMTKLNDALKTPVPILSPYTTRDVTSTSVPENEAGLTASPTLQVSLASVTKVQSTPTPPWTISPTATIVAIRTSNSTVGLSPTATFSQIPSLTPHPKGSVSPTATLSVTPSLAPVYTAPVLPTSTATITPPYLPTFTRTLTPTDTPVPPPSTPTPTSTQTQTPTPTHTPVRTLPTQAPGPTKKP